MAHRQYRLVAFLLLIPLITLGSARAQQEELWDSPNAVRALTARIEIRDQVDISIDTPGRLVLLEPAQVGGVVEKGQIVAKIDDRLVRAQLQELKLEAESDVQVKFMRIALENAQIELQDMKDRNKKAGSGVFSEKEIRAAELEVKKAEASLEQAEDTEKLNYQKVETKEVELSLYTAHAGFGGIVTDMHSRSVGAAVRQGDPIMTIVNLDEVLADVTVSPEDFARIQLKDTVLVRATTSANPVRENGSAAPSPFSGISKGSRIAKPVSVRASKEDPVTFVGEVIDFGKTANVNQDNSRHITAKIKNKLGGPGKYLLVEGVYVKAVILSQE